MLRTLALEGGELDVLGVLNDRIADGRDVSWVWDADWELLAPHVRRMTCAGTRAAELALRMKYAGVDPARLHVVDEPAGRRSTRRSPTATGRSTSLPTYTALLELRELLAERGHARGVLAMTRRGHLSSLPGSPLTLPAPAVVIWHDVECGGYDADLPLWRALAARPTGRSSTSAPAPAASRCSWRARATT